MYNNIPKEFENEIKGFLAMKINYDLTMQQARNATGSGGLNNPED